MPKIQQAKKYTSVKIAPHVVTTIKAFSIFVDPIGSH
jgi:hypothetical protein